MRKVLLGLLLVPFACWPSAGTFAEDPVDDRPSRYDDPTGKSSGNGFSNQVFLEAGDADAKATGQIAGVFSKGGPNYGRYKFSVTAPFDPKKSDKVDVGTLSGVTAGTNATLEIGWLRWEKASWPQQSAIDQYCAANVPKAIPGYTWDMVSLAAPSATCAIGMFTKKTLDIIIKEIIQARECAKNPPTDNPQKLAFCQELQSAGPPHLANINLDSLEAGLDKLVNSSLRPIRSVSVGGTVNRQEFTYVLATDPQTKLKQNKTGHRIFLAYTEIDQGLLWTVGVAVEKARKGGDKVQICNLIGTTGSSACFEGAIGAPASKDSNTVFGEGRFLINGKHFALSPRAEYDFKNTEWAIRLPMYFVTNAKGQLTAGMTVGYSSDKDDLMAAVFIGKAFSFVDQ